MARRYFDAIAARDVEAAVALWAEGGREYVRGQVDVIAPEGVREFIGGLIEAMPDMKMEVVETTTEGERCAVRWTLTGTFAGPGALNGVQATGSPLKLEGVDVLTVREGKVQANDAFSDGMTAARQIGLMPPQGSSAEQRLMGAFNVKTKVTGMSSAQDAELVAEGVWVVQGHLGRCNVYLIEDAELGGVTLYDAGSRTDDPTRSPPPAPSSAASSGWSWDTRTPTTAASRPHLGCRCCAIPTSARTPKAAAAFATGRLGWPGCRPRSAKSTAPCTATPGTPDRCASPAPSPREMRSPALG